MIILTGGAGFIGSGVLAALNAQGISNILVVDNLGESEKWKNLGNKIFHDYVHKDQFLRLINSNATLGPVEGIIHMGACSSTYERNAEYMLENNYRYSRQLCLWAAKLNARFIYASTAATYGDGAHGFDDSDTMTTTLLPLNVYGYSKQLFDLWALRNGLLARSAGLKFFNVFGPNEYHKGPMRSVVYNSFQQIREKGSVQLFKSYRSDYKHGEQRRDFIFVKDCVNVILWLLKNPQVNGLFNLGTGKSRTWNDLANAVFAALEKKPKIEFIEMPETLRDRYQYFTEAKMEKLRQAGYNQSFTSLEDGVREYVREYLQPGERVW